MHTILPIKMLYGKDLSIISCEELRAPTSRRPFTSIRPLIEKILKL
jgi:hypothetical protein